MRKDLQDDTEIELMEGERAPKVHGSVEEAEGA